jgi:hypothetical protein
VKASSDAQFLRGLAHDLSDWGVGESEQRRLREIADRLEAEERDG